MADHLLQVNKRERIVGDTVILLLSCPDCDLRFNGRLTPPAGADNLIAIVTLAHQIQAGGASCCDMHNEHCEPPSELCCWLCTEAAHDTFPTRHADGSRCMLSEPEARHGS